MALGFAEATGVLLMRLTQPYARASAILSDELDTGTPQDTFNQRNRVLASGVTTDLDIGNRVSMKACRFCEIAHRPI